MHPAFLRRARNKVKELKEAVCSKPVAAIGGAMNDTKK